MERLVAEAEIETKEEDLRLQRAIRCVNALSLVSSLKSSPNPYFNDHQELEDVSKLQDLRIELLATQVKARNTKRSFELCMWIDIAQMIMAILLILTAVSAA